MQPKIVDGHLVIDDELRAAHKADAQRITARIHLFALAKNHREQMIAGEPVADGLDGTLLCGGRLPIPKEECIFTSDVSDESDELSRILWENFPNRCQECVLRDKLRRAMNVVKKAQNAH